MKSMRPTSEPTGSSWNPSHPTEVDMASETFSMSLPHISVSNLEGLVAVDEWTPFYPNGLRDKGGRHMFQTCLQPLILSISPCVTMSRCCFFSAFAAVVRGSSCTTCTNSICCVGNWGNTFLPFLISLSPFSKMIYCNHRALQAYVSFHLIKTKCQSSHSNPTCHYSSQGWSMKRTSHDSTCYCYTSH